MSDKFLRNDGLTLQKSKTRIMSSAEFRSAYSHLVDPEQDTNSDVQKLFALKLRYDPYSANASEEYAELRKELQKIDILGLLNRELAKTRVHGALTKKLIAAVRHLETSVKTNAVLTLVDNMDALYALFPVLAVTIKTCLADLSEAARQKIGEALRKRVIGESYILNNELHAAYAVRIFSEMKTADNFEVLVTLYNRFRGPLVRRDVILVMAKWRNYPFLSDQIGEYTGASPWERRALIIASYFMGDSGGHWRQSMVKQFNPFELIVRDWAAEKYGQSGWSLPI